MTELTLTPADVTEMDRLQDVLRSSPHGLCELLVPALGFDHWERTLERLRDLRGLDIESALCVGLHERGTRLHRRLIWHWTPRLQLTFGRAWRIPAPTMRRSDS